VVADVVVSVVVTDEDVVEVVVVRVVNEDVVEA